MALPPFDDGTGRTDFKAVAAMQAVFLTNGHGLGRNVNALLRTLGIAELAANTGVSDEIVSSILCAYILHPRLGTENHARERGIPRTAGLLYRQASPSEREAQYGNGIPVWFCLAYNFLCSDSSILTSISSGALFQTRDIVLRKQKSRPPKKENG